jgi:hypothetical protein
VSSAPRRWRLSVVATSRFGCRFVKWVPWSRPGQCMAGGAQGGGNAPRPRAVRRVAPGPLTAPPVGGARAGKHLAGAGGRTARRKRHLDRDRPRPGGAGAAVVACDRTPPPGRAPRRPACASPTSSSTSLEACPLRASSGTAGVFTFAVRPGLGEFDVRLPAGRARPAPAGPRARRARP